MGLGLLAVVCFASLTLGGEIEFPFNLKLLWRFTSETTIEFDLEVPEEVFEDYGWAGVGIKELSTGGNMANGDFVTVSFDPLKIEDRYSASNGYAHRDQVMAGKDNLSWEDKVTKKDSKYVYTWSRQLQTGEKYDCDLIKDREYYLLWAVGPVIEGDTAMHSSEERGTFQIVLSEDFQQEYVGKVDFLSILK